MPFLFFYFSFLFFPSIIVFSSSSCPSSYLNFYLSFATTEKERKPLRQRNASEQFRIVCLLFSYYFKTREGKRREEKRQERKEGRRGNEERHKLRLCSVQTQTDRQTETENAGSEEVVVDVPSPSLPEQYP